jgi:hypothetical protein
MTYALQDAARHDDLKGAGHGFVDIFDTDRNLIRRLASRAGRLGRSDPGLWGITFGTELATEPHTLYFTAGTSNYVCPMTSGRGAL